MQTQTQRLAPFFCVMQKNCVMSRLAAILAGASLGGAALGSAVFARRMHWQFEFVPKAQPHNRAFAIWLVIYATCVAYAAVLSIHDLVDSASLVAPLFAACAFVATMGWVTCARNGWLAAAAVSIGLSAAFALIAACYGPRIEPVATAWLGHAAMGLLAGWLVVASALAFVLSRGASSRVDRSWALVPVALVLCAVAIAARRPLLLVPCIWAAINSPHVPWASATVVSLSGVGAALAALRAAKNT